MGTLGEITVLIKFSPKREKILRAINEKQSTKIMRLSDGNDDDFEQASSLSKLSVARWTVRANAFNKVCKNVYR